MGTKRYVQLLALFILAMVALASGLAGGKSVLAGIPVVAPSNAQVALQPSTQKPAVSAIYRGTTTPVHFDVSPPLRSMAPLQAYSAQKRENEERDRDHPLPGPLMPGVGDTVLQSKLGPFTIPTPIISFDGPSNTCNCAPPDPNGEVGRNHYVVMTNLSFQIYNKTGTSLYGPAANNTLWAGFGGACQTENAGDPVVLYDQLADRWLLSQFTAAGPTYYNCVAVSTSPDPTGSYYRYAFTTGNNFPDYPKYGMWPDAYYISTREFAGSGGPFAGVGAYALNRAQMLAGNPSAQVVSVLAPPSPAYNVGDGLLPADMDGSNPPPAGNPEYFVGSMDNNGPYSAPQDALTLWKFHADFVTPANTTFTLVNTLPTAAFNTAFPCASGVGARDCIGQPGTANKIDMLSYRQRPIFRLAYRNMGTYESLLTNQSVDAGAGPGGDIAGVRWYELRSPLSAPFIYQQGTYAPGISDGIHRWMGSLAMDASGDIALGYSASSTSVFPSIRYTGRVPGDALGLLPQGEASIIAGTGSQTGVQRWGDYTDMTVDPLDDCTFWYVNEYVPTTSSNGWRARIGSFKFPSCSAAITTPTSTSTRTSTATNTPTITLTSTSTATATPAPAVLIGHVTWQGPPAQPSVRQQLPITLTLCVGGAPVNYSLTTDSSGFFTVTTSLPTGSYNWRVKGPKYLATAGTLTLTAGGTTQVEMGLQKAGDVDNTHNNVVNSTDFSALKAVFGQASSVGDLNNDGVTNTTDFTLLKGNFGQSGAAANCP